MKTNFKERLGLALMILSMMTPMVSHADSAIEADSAAMDQHGGQAGTGNQPGGSAQAGGGQQAGGGRAGGAPVAGAPTAGAPVANNPPANNPPAAAPTNGGQQNGGQHDGGADHNPRPTPPMHVGGPNPTQRPPERHDNNNNGRLAVAAAGTAVNLGIAIFNAVQRAKETRVKSYSWLNGTDSDVHCYGMNEYGRVANGNLVNESICLQTAPKPVVFQYERYQDGYDYCYKISTIDNTYLNNNYPVDNANCPLPVAQ